MEEWVVFRHGERELCRITVFGLFSGEIEATKEHLAHENNIEVEDIDVSIEID